MFILGEKFFLAPNHFGTIFFQLTKKPCVCIFLFYEKKKKVYDFFNESYDLIK